MKTIPVPAYAQVSPANQALFDSLKKGLGMVPNLYATFAHSEHALGNYLALQSGKSSLSAKARELINLVVSQVNACEYCLAAHTAIGKMTGYTDAQILEIRVTAYSNAALAGGLVGWSAGGAAATLSHGCFSSSPRRSGS